MFKMALGWAARSAGEATVAAMTAAAGRKGSGSRPVPIPRFLEARPFTPKRRQSGSQSGSLPPVVGFHFILLTK